MSFSLFPVIFFFFFEVKWKSTSNWSRKKEEEKRKEKTRDFYLFNQTIGEHILLQSRYGLTSVINLSTLRKATSPHNTKELLRNMCFLCLFIDFLTNPFLISRSAGFAVWLPYSVVGRIGYDVQPNDISMIVVHLYSMKLK
jgi:hypothetical protein